MTLVSVIVGLITCRSDCLRETVNLSVIVAAWIVRGDPNVHRAPEVSWVSVKSVERLERKQKEAGEAWHVDENHCKDAKMHNPWVTRVRVTKCDYAAQLRTCCTLFTPHPVSWLEVVLQAPETWPNSEKNLPVVRVWRMLRIPNARLSLGLVPRRRWRSCLQVDLRAWRRCLHVEFSNLSVFGSTTQSSSPLPSNCCPFRCLFCWLRGIYLYSCWLDMQSFALSFRLSKVGSLIEWKLSSSFRICRKNPIFESHFFQLS